MKRIYRLELDLFAQMLRSVNPHGRQNKVLFYKLIFTCRVARSEGISRSDFYLDVMRLGGRDVSEWNKRIAGRWAANAWKASENHV